MLAESQMMAIRGTPRDAQQYLAMGEAAAQATKSAPAIATVAIHRAQLERRMRRFAAAEALLSEAATAIEHVGPGSFWLARNAV